MIYTVSDNKQNKNQNTDIDSKQNKNWNSGIDKNHTTNNFHEHSK